MANCEFLWSSTKGIYEGLRSKTQKVISKVSYPVLAVSLILPSFVGLVYIVQKTALAHYTLDLSASLPSRAGSSLLYYLAELLFIYYLKNWKCP